jgi:hypothetical protein
MKFLDAVSVKDDVGATRIQKVPDFNSGRAL